MIQRIASPTRVVSAARRICIEVQTTILARVTVPAPECPHGNILPHAAARVAGLGEVVRAAAKNLELPGRSDRED